MTQRVDFDIVDGGSSVDMQVAGDAEAIDLSVEPAGKGTTDYTELENKPSIEGVTLTGDVSLEDIGAADAEDVQAAQETADAALTASGKAVRFDAAQTLTDAQKAQARGNVGAADAAEVGELKSALTGPLLNLLRNVAYINDQGQSYYDALYAALHAGEYPRIAAVYTPGSHVVYTDDSLDTLKTYMTVIYYETVQSAGTTVAANDYTLTGTLVDGENAIIVGYDGMVTSIQVEAVDYYNQWNASLSSGVLQNLPGSSGVGTVPCNIYISTGWNNLYNRRVICAKRGRTAYEDYNTSEAVSNAYPIPVPASANRVTLTITPSTQQFGGSIVKLSNGVYSVWQVSGDWENPKIIDFTASNDLFIILNCRHDSSNSNYNGDEPTEFAVVFETV